jgi:hypothetical protein
MTVKGPFDPVDHKIMNIGSLPVCHASRTTPGSRSKDSLLPGNPFHHSEKEKKSKEEPHSPCHFSFIAISLYHFLHQKATAPRSMARHRVICFRPSDGATVLWLLEFCEPLTYNADVVVPNKFE